MGLVVPFGFATFRLRPVAWEADLVLAVFWVGVDEAAVLEVDGEELLAGRFPVEREHFDDHAFRIEKDVTAAGELRDVGLIGSIVFPPLDRELSRVPEQLRGDSRSLHAFE